MRSPREPRGRATGAVGLGALAVVLACACACAAVVGCAGDPSADPGVEGPYTSLADRPCPEGSILTWENFGDPFMLSWCTGCHSASLAPEARPAAPPGIDFNDVESVKAHLERVWVRAGDDNRTMPPAGGPGAAERALLGEWLACGAPTRAELENAL